MPQFILETAGAVTCHGAPCICHARTWQQLEPFTRGYIEALFFTESEPGTTADTHDPETQLSLPGDAGFADLAPAALHRIIADCGAFQRDAAEMLSEAYELEPGSEAFRYARDCIDAQRAGQLFWYARNGHGVTFTDDGDAGCLERLQEVAERFGNVDAYLGDDSAVHLA